MKTVFFIGNKRCGTSLLTRLLNRHPNLFISHESDTPWILWHAYRNLSPTTHCNDLDPSGMVHTMNKYSHLINRDRTAYENFMDIQLRLMNDGSPWLPPFYKTLECIGDKQPNTTLDIVDYVRRKFPGAYFIHCVRHPGDFVESAKGFKDKLNYGKKRKDMLEWWVKYEKRVKSLRFPIITVKYVDLCNDPNGVTNDVFKKLGLKKFDINLKKKLKPKVYKKRKVKLTKDALKLIEEYGLE